MTHLNNAITMTNGNVFFLTISGTLLDFHTAVDSPDRRNKNKLMKEQALFTV